MFSLFWLTMMFNNRVNLCLLNSSFSQPDKDNNSCKNRILVITAELFEFYKYLNPELILELSRNADPQLKQMDWLTNSRK